MAKAKIKTVYKKTKGKKGNGLDINSPIASIAFDKLSRTGAIAPAAAAPAVMPVTAPKPVVAPTIETLTGLPTISPTVSPASALVQASTVNNESPVTMNPGTVPSSQPLVSPVMTVTPVQSATPTPTDALLTRTDPGIIAQSALPSANPTDTAVSMPTATQINNNIILYIVLALVAIYVLIYLFVGSKKS